MSPPRAASADLQAATQTPEEIAAALQLFLDSHRQGAVLEEGKVLFELAKTHHKLTTDNGRCTLQLWSGDRNLVRSVASTEERKNSLRLATRRFGQTQTRALTLVPALERREPNRRDPARQAYQRLLERVLGRAFPDWQPEAFRTAMDLERSFGPAYARGAQVRGSEAWAVIGVGATESLAIIDGILSLGILWLHHCRENGGGRRLVKGLRLVVPRGAATLTLARLAWMNTGAAQWELYELDEATEDLQRRDPEDQGNLRTRLVHHPDEAAARERFATAIDQVLALVPNGETHRVEQRLRSTAELAFLLHGLEFARARISLAPGSFTHVLEITVGAGPAETVLTAATCDDLADQVAQLFLRRDAHAVQGARSLRAQPPGRAIGAFTGRPAHGRLSFRTPDGDTGEDRPDRLAQRDRALAAQQDPLFRAAPERWLESVLRENLAPLTRSLAPAPQRPEIARGGFANDLDPDTRGNRCDAQPAEAAWGWGRPGRTRATEQLIPRFDPRFVYAQVPAIAGAGDRGMLDLLGLTEDGRLAVIELKAADDLHLALQGLDYWIRVRHHCSPTLGSPESQPGATNDLQRHGYFRGVALSTLPPRLYLVAPALHLHPATETILRYLSPRVQWTLLALDERWRQQVRVVWRKSGGSATAQAAR